MKIKEIVDNLDGMPEEERIKWIEALMGKLCRLSHGQMEKFKNTWNPEGKKTIDDFNKAQNEELKMCVALEVSVIGQNIRKAMGLAPLSLDDEIQLEGE